MFVITVDVPDDHFVPLPLAVTATKFPLGCIVMTANASGQLDAVEVEKALRRHAAGDWGDLPPEDAEQNESGLKHGERLFSAYGAGGNCFWIVTERDRSVTTVLLPLDY
jgi:hypothetical protein